MIPRADWALLGLVPTSGAALPFRDLGELIPRWAAAQPTAVKPSVAHIVVRAMANGWSVERDDMTYGRFSRFDDAKDHATALARHQTQCGHVVMLTVEFHPESQPRGTPRPAFALAGDDLDPGIAE
ncbi:hypothetical protein [Phenylobacterium sp.]|uniref:hypothetical protein n=1 Tax=Phenylobacterium sp. TaxID=1871053 RepID=UPI00286C5646|nr:hypothetical protein [Phenylobacterium sp.]